jgi:hypothetical protein
VISASPLPCSDCLEKVRCPSSEQAEIAKAAFFALKKDQQPQCGDYAPRWFRGIEGVKQ